MELNKSFTINGNVVEETNKTIAGYKLYVKFDNDERFMTIYFVDKHMNVKNALEIKADESQGLGYISKWGVKNF